MTTMTPEWRFMEMTRGEINVDLLEGEFFITEALGSNPDALVRDVFPDVSDRVSSICK